MSLVKLLLLLEQTLGYSMRPGSLFLHKLFKFLYLDKFPVNTGILPVRSYLDSSLLLVKPILDVQSCRSEFGGRLAASLHAGMRLES